VEILFPKQLKKTLIKLSQLSSHAAIIEAWLEVEFSASALAEKNSLKLPSARSMSPLGLGYELHHAGLLSKAQLEI